MLAIERSPQGENKTAKSRFVHSASQQRIHFLTTESFIQIFYQHICFLHTALSGKAPKTPVQKVSHYLLKAFFRNPPCCYTKLLSHPSEGRLTRVPFTTVLPALLCQVLWERVAKTQPPKSQRMLCVAALELQKKLQSNTWLGQICY